MKGNLQRAVVRKIVITLMFVAACLPSPTPSAAGTLGDCWDTVKDIGELHGAIGEAAASYIEDPECAAYYELPAFWGFTSALAAIRVAGGPDCEDASANKAIAAVLDKAGLPLPESVKSEIHAVATGQADKALSSIPGLGFYTCSCKVSHADEDVRKFLETAQEALNDGKDCVAAIGEAILNVPGLLAEGAGFLADLLGSIPGLGDLINFVGDFLESAGCLISEDLAEFFFGADCDEEPSPEDKLRDHLNAHLAELCHNAGLTDAEIDALAKQAGGGFAERCKNERDNAKTEQIAMLCQATGGSWIGGQFAFCSCPPGKSHGTWCEPEPCPPPYTPPIIR